MFLQDMTKTLPDWHLLYNSNLALIADKLIITADCTYDETGNSFIVSPVNIPQDFADELPGNLPPLFSMLAKMPEDYVEDAVVTVGSEQFTPKYAAFEGGDVVIICFDNAEKRCFFRASGGSAGGSSAYAGAAYAGADYLG